VVADAAESINFTRWDIFHGGNICDVLGGGVAAAVAAASIYFRGLFFRGIVFTRENIRGTLGCARRPLRGGFDKKIEIYLPYLYSTSPCTRTVALDLCDKREPFVESMYTT